MRTITLVLVAAVAGCSASSEPPPAAVAGNYTLTVTDQQNGCSVENFATNASQTGITIAIAQNGGFLSATVMGSSGLVLAFSTGDTISGTIEGEEASLSSSASHMQGNCAYSTTATANIAFHNGQAQGTMLYTDTGNGDPSCGVMQQCTSTQTFTGTLMPGT
jgi:hypothetical protein